mmetsp:Transcript_29736/g.62624  ORF Transcript_29736/g.62624 Transcript_29736/m.62624 type:complete len:178 (-) Transcript_29736:67-600(-)
MQYMVGSQFIKVSANNEENKDGSSDCCGSGSSTYDANIILNNNDNNDQCWRRFSAREVARLQGFPEDFVLHKDRAHHMLGNAVCPPVIAFLAAHLLEYVHLNNNNNKLGSPKTPEEEVEEERRRKSNNNDCGSGGSGDSWGWNVAKSLILEASPNDSRREELITKFSAVQYPIVLEE